MVKLRPVKRLINVYDPGQGKAQIVEKPSQLSHILFVASRGQLGRRNVAIVMMLFGSGMRINEVAQLKVSDVYSEDGSLKEIFNIPASYTKTGKSRLGYLLCKQQREALEIWKEQRLIERAMLSDDDKYNGLLKDSPLFLSKKGNSWRKFAFNTKKYCVKEEGRTVTKETLICSSLENLVRGILKSSGLHGGSSHRKTLISLDDGS